MAIRQRFVLDVATGFDITMKWLAEVIRVAVADQSTRFGPEVQVKDVTGQQLRTNTEFVDKVGQIFGMQIEGKLNYNPSLEELGVRACAQGVAERNAETEIYREKKRSEQCQHTLKVQIRKLEGKVSEGQCLIEYHREFGEWLTNHATWRQRHFGKGNWFLHYDRWRVARMGAAAESR